MEEKKKKKILFRFVKSGQPFKCAYCKIICLQGIECKLCETRVHPKCAEKVFYFNLKTKTKKNKLQIKKSVKE